MRKLMIFLMLLGTSAYGQMVQYGKVTEMDEHGNLLAGTTLTVPTEHDCQPTQSDSKGCFRLCFDKHSVGDVVSQITARKKGYEVVNIHVTRNWTLTTADTLRIVMAPKNKVKEARLKYYELSGLLPDVFLPDGLSLYEVESQLFAFHISHYENGVAPSDVDVDIPVAEEVNDKTFAVIIANEDYQREQNVPFAKHDGEVFKEYCTRLLGIPEENIHWVTDATLNNIRYEVDWLEATLAAYPGEAKGIFYYSGHGIPDETSRSAYLLPVDGYGTNMASSYGLDELYAQLGSVDAELITYFVDACFSGATREGEMMAETRGVAVNSKAGELQGNAIAFSAARGNETAFAYDEKSHGMFTYYLLKKLKESRGDLTAGELADYLNENVARMSALQGMKTQRPSANGTMQDWRTIKLK